MIAGGLSVFFTGLAWVCKKLATVLFLSGDHAIESGHQAMLS